MNLHLRDGDLTNVASSAGMLEWFAAGRYDRQPAAFLDRDGVINEHIAGGYVLRPADFRWLPGVVEALRRISDSGRKLIFVTNQSCINRGLLRADDLRSIMTDMVSTLGAAGVPSAAWLCCPHRPDERCACRKPGTAMLERAAQVLGLSLERSVLLGDSESDTEAAQRVGMHGILVERNNPQAFGAAVERLVRGAV